jgi:hypothetical protein
MKVLILTTGNHEHDKDYLYPNSGFASDPATVLRKEYVLTMAGITDRNLPVNDESF